MIIFLNFNSIIDQYILGFKQCYLPSLSLIFMGNIYLKKSRIHISNSNIIELLYSFLTHSSYSTTYFHRSVATITCSMSHTHMIPK